MTQTVVAVFDNPDSALAAEETLITQGIDQSAFHVAIAENLEDSPLQSTESLDDVRIYLSDLFGPDEADSYLEEIDRGGVLLSVDLPDDAEIESVRDAMLEAGAFDVNEQYNQAGEDSEGGTTDLESGSEETQGQAMPMVEETLDVGKRAETGTVRVGTRLEETPVEQDIELQEQHAKIERRPLDQPIDAKDVEALGQRQVEIEETTEKPVVGKSARVVGEVQVGSESQTKTETVRGTVRHTEVDVQRDETAKGGKPKGGRGKS